MNATRSAFRKSVFQCKHFEQFILEAEATAHMKKAPQPRGAFRHSVEVNGIVSPQFEGQSRIDRQRTVMNLLKTEFSSGLHALEIKVSAPSENIKF